MTLSAIEALLESRFNTQWGVTTPIAWDSVDYTPVSGTSYVTFKVMPTYSDQASLGKHPLIRSTGLVEINVMTPVNNGPRPGATLADSVLAVFRDAYGRGWKSGTLTCHAGYVSNKMEESEWYRHIVLIPFEYDESF